MRKPKEQYPMIIRCYHLREAGIMNECCSHCHVLAGCVVRMLPNDHKAIFCCGRIDPFTQKDLETLLAKIPEWEVKEKFPSLQEKDDQRDASSLRTDGSLPSTIPAFPDRFRPAYQALQRLEGYEHYRAAIIFGSVVRGEATKHSNLDALVIVNGNTSCRNINHPIIDGVKLNLIFLSLEQFQERTRKEIDQHQRMKPLTMAESIIIFDKTNKLHYMWEGAQQLQPQKVSPKEQQRIQSMLFQCNDMVECNLKEEPLTALLVMHSALICLLMSHYRVHQKWWVSPHRLLTDLKNWDMELAQLVENFLATSEVHIKFQCWSTITDHILQSLGSRQPVTAQNCLCSRCQYNVSMLLKA